MNQSCCVCRSGTILPYSELSWEIWGQNYRLGLCSSCGSAHTDPLPEDRAIERLYTTSFNYNWYRDHMWAKLRDCRQRMKEYAPLLGYRVLDYGGGLGYFSRVARERGYHSVTYDPYISKAQLEDNTWDTLVCLHMLEHSNSPDPVIECMKNLLTADGRLILAVPNFSGEGYRQFGMDWVWAQPPLLHVFHFTAGGLVSLLDRHGFKDFSVSYHERWDANMQSDVTEVGRFRKLDADWRKLPCSAFRLCQKVIALRNSLLRFRSLSKALGRCEPNKIALAELQIVCHK
jgi:SAM-dependent methyltransferase